MADITYKQGAALSVGYSGAAKIFSFISSLLLAYLFGASAKMDIYFYIILASALLNGWLQAVSSSVIIPQFIHLKHKNTEEALNFANFFLYCLLAAAVFIVALFCFFPSEGLAFISKFPAALIERYKYLPSLGALYFSSFLIMNYLIYLTESYKLFSIYKLGLLNTVLPLIALIIFKSPEAMFAGYIAAYITQTAACVYLLKKRALWRFNFKKPVFDEKFIKNFWAFQPNNLIWSALAYAPLFLISSAGAGVVSTLNYARMISDTPVDVLVSKVSNVARVKLTTDAAKNDNAALASAFFKTDKTLLFILTPVCVFTAVFAQDIVKLLFMRGSFDEQAALGTAYFLKFLIIATPFISLSAIFSGASGALRIVRQTVIRYSVLALFFIGVYFYGINKWGPYVYPWIFLFLYLFITGFNAYTAKQYMPFVSYRKHILYLVKVFMLSLLSALAAKHLLYWFEGGLFWVVFLKGCVFVTVNFLLLLSTGTLREFIAEAGFAFKRTSLK